MGSRLAGGGSGSGKTHRRCRKQSSGDHSATSACKHHCWLSAVETVRAAGSNAPAHADGAACEMSLLGHQHPGPRAQQLCRTARETAPHTRCGGRGQGWRQEAGQHIAKAARDGSPAKQKWNSAETQCAMPLPVNCIAEEEREPPRWTSLGEGFWQQATFFPALLVYAPLL